RWSRRPLAHRTALRRPLLPEPRAGLLPLVSLGFRSVNERPASVRENPCLARSPMLITCTSCGTSYQVAAASLGPTGRSVRCARCRQTWLAATPGALADVAEAHRADLTALAEAPPVADSPAPEQHFAPAQDVWPETSQANQTADQALGGDAGMT